MKLEEEIKQSSFKSEYHKVAINIFYTNNWLFAINEAIFKRFDITVQQFNILRILRGQHPKPASIKLLKERMLDKMSDASRLVEKLRKKDLVERKICKDDRRSVDVVISDKGLALLKELDHLDEDFTKHFRGLSESEAKLLNELLDKMRG